MALTAPDLDRIARLARLALDDTEKEHYLSQLNGIFGVIEALNQAPTNGIEPLAHPLAALEPLHLRLRADEVTEPTDSAASQAARAANMTNAPAQQDGLFLVPKVIE